MAMVKLALLVAIALASGCFDDRYHCTSDMQCNLGEGGRCEVDGNCTVHDTRCPTLRRYAAHSGELTDQCFDDSVAPVNPCAGGQPPAKAEGCFADVCDRLPACCAVGWFDACAQVAQETASCNLRCDTRIAITATRSTTTEQWDARWNGDQWSFTARDDLAALQWVAPAPGDSEPRLCGATAEELVIGDTHIPVPPGRSYGSITSIGFDRDRRDTIAATYNDGRNRLELWKLDKLTVHEQGVPGTGGLTWGEADRDSYPDAIVKVGGSQFGFLYNVEDDTFQHSLLNQTAGSMAGGATPGAPQVRSFDWLDINDDNKLDLAIFGAEVRMHTNQLGLGDPAARQFDCDPPTAARECSMDTNEPNLEASSFAGAGLPVAGDASIVFSLFPGRQVYRAKPDGSVAPFKFPGDTCSCVKTCTGGCPGPSCTCTYNCNACVPVLAFVARDVDGDHALDLIAIDAKLQIFVAKAANGYQWGGATSIPTAFPNTFFSVDVSVTGAPIP
ncbi:MAG TPA: hypothetical protein VFV99_11350 [Kofleriaceae bacterium]|nr:hypothetical protein [Kofleriaceae bacterium]